MYGRPIEREEREDGIHGLLLSALFLSLNGRSMAAIGFCKITSKLAAASNSGSTSKYV